MIYGIGIDLEETQRISDLYEQWGDSFVKKILSGSEQSLFQNRLKNHEHKGIEYLATRFAVKEAFVKALGFEKPNAPTDWHSMSVLSDEHSGAPILVFDGKLKEWLVGQQLKVHVSLSDSHHYVTAIVLIERN